MAIKKNVNTKVKQDIKVENKKQDIDIQELINQVTQKITLQMKSEYEQQIKALKDQLQSNVVINNIAPKKKYKFIDEQKTKVRIQSNIGGTFIYHEDKKRIYIQLNGYGDTALISYDELRTFYTASPSFIKTGQIAIIDVYADQDGVEFEDVIEELRLTDIYFNTDRVNPLNIGILFDSSIDIKDFEKLINNSKYMAETVLEIAYILFRQGLFNDNSKMNFLRQIFSRPNLFK